MKRIKIESLKMKDLLISLIFDNKFYDDELKNEIKAHLIWKDVITELTEDGKHIYIIFVSGFKIELPMIKGNRTYNLFIDYSNHLDNESEYHRKKEITYNIKCSGCRMEFIIICSEIQKDIRMTASPGEIVRNELSNFEYQRLHCCNCGRHILFSHETIEMFSKIKRVEFDFNDCRVDFNS